MLEARDVSVAFGARQALLDVSLTVAPGEVVALCGPNGAGKSTLIGVLSGDIRPGGGAAYLDGSPLRGVPPAALAVKRAMLEQSPSIASRVTAYDLASLAIPREISPQAAEEIAKGALAAVGLSAMARQVVNTLSGGQQRRAHLARVLAQLASGRRLGHGEALILDEPTAGLDIAHQITAMEAARGAAAEGAAVIVAVHDLGLAAAYADRMALMAQGRVVTIAPPAEVLEAARLTAVYGAPVHVFTDPSGALCVAPIYHQPAGTGLTQGA